MSTYMTIRRAWDKVFTILSGGSVVILGILLVIVLVPMLGKGCSAVFFRETIEFRKMEFAELGRGDEQKLKEEVAQVTEARKPIYDLINNFSEGIDTERQRNRAREMYRLYGEQLRLKNTPSEQYSEYRGRAKDLRNLLQDAYEAIDAETAKSFLQKVLEKRNDPIFQDTAISEYFHMAERYMRTVETIDLSKRDQYAIALNEVQEALKKLLGPRPSEDLPPLAENRYGATRWDLMQRDLDHLMYATVWVEEEPGQPLVKKKIPRTDPSQFGGTELKPLFGTVKNNLDAIFRPQRRFYWQYFIDGSTPGHFFGGVGPEVLGTLLLSICAMLFAVPLGIISAAYLVECGGNNFVMKVIRTCINTLAGVPSIVFGLFGLAFFVLVVFGKPCILAASLTLGLLVLPVVIRASEEAIRAVPRTYKEASLALGAGRFRTFVMVILPAAMPGILTGIILSVSRAAGETAPILFTGAVFFGNVPKSLMGQTPALSYGIHGIATGDRVGMQMPHQQFGMVMTLVLLVLCLNMAAIILRARISKKLRGY
ncbi:MAG: phosphate ABC transporter permease PstA [Sedimentisphaerales bacterium]|nr:phosphate ABC transporter permease PstA [Sedimentisphaerales bacterium]